MLIVALTVMAFGLTGCANRNTDAALSRAEAIVESDSRSALKILRSINPSALKTAEQQALYGLLMTRASDRCNQDIAALDSLIIPAERYFTAAADPRREMLAKHCLARVRLEQGDPHSCILLDLKALEIAKSLNAPLFVGLTTRTIADAYSITYNYSDALNYYKESLDVFRQNNLHEYTGNAMYDYASALIHCNKVDSGLVIVQEAVDFLNGPYGENDSTLRVYLKMLSADGYFLKRDYETAVSIWETIMPSGMMNRSDSLLLGSSYLKLGFVDKANEILKSLPDSTDLNYAYLKYELFAETNRNDSAAVFMKMAYDMTNSVIEQMMGGSLSSSIAGYYDESNKATKSRFTTALVRNRIIIGVMLVVVIICGVLLRNYYCQTRRHKRQNARLTKRIVRLIAKNGETTDNYKTLVKELLATHHSLLDQISRIIYENPDSKHAKRKIMEKIDGLISDYQSNKKKIEELERFVDENYGNIYTDFKADFPSIKELDYQTFLFSFLGFSAPSIAIFFKDSSVTAVYSRKRHLKDRIKHSECSRKAEYLSIFD